MKIAQYTNVLYATVQGYICLGTQLSRINCPIHESRTQLSRNLSQDAIGRNCLVCDCPIHECLVRNCPSNVYRDISIFFLILFFSLSLICYSLSISSSHSPFFSFFLTILNFPSVPIISLAFSLSLFLSFCLFLLRCFFLNLSLISHSSPLTFRTYCSLFSSLPHFSITLFLFLSLLSFPLSAPYLSHYQFRDLNCSLSVSLLLPLPLPPSSLSLTPLSPSLPLSLPPSFSLPSSLSPSSISLTPLPPSLPPFLSLSLLYLPNSLSLPPSIPLSLSLLSVTNPIPFSLSLSRV
ncbi:unnamed protein product [Acanthosepion pharaonis]|uniref:Uncharacterized protein n=1 Tax=Acanthosepion pharaonis TaxID=158019 RepID=A0A812B1D9_ACAPH|nr:unnamed protein product [Sepia pharaonis]